MRYSNRLFITAVAACMMMLTASNAHAQFFGRNGKDKEQMRQKMEARMQEVFEQLGLSEEQKKLLEENKARHKSQSETLRREQKESMKMMGEELKKKDLNNEQIDALRARFKSLRDQMEDERFNAIIEVRKILTQEQFAKFVELTEHYKDAK